MLLLRAWFAGYGPPARFAEALRGGPAPLPGFLAMLVRAVLDALLLYLPLHLLGRVPPTPSWLVFLPTEGYYGSLVWLTPPVLAAEWLLGGAAAHLALRLAGRPGGIDCILNVTGVVNLVVGAFLLAWDWTWVGLGVMDQWALGLSHLGLAGWGMVLTAAALKRLLDLPAWLAALLNLPILAVSLPLAMLFMRSPL